MSMLDASTLDIIRTHNVFKCPVTSISASPDSKLIAACSRRGDVVVLDEERALVSLRSGSGACVIAADFGRDAKRRFVFRTRGDDGVVDYWRLDGRRTRRYFRVEDLPGSEPWAWRSGFAEGRCVASNMKGVVAVADDDGLELRTGAGEARGFPRRICLRRRGAGVPRRRSNGLVTAARGARGRRLGRGAGDFSRASTRTRRRRRLLQRWRRGRGSRWTGTGPSNQHFTPPAPVELRVRQYRGVDLPGDLVGARRGTSCARRGARRGL